MRTSRPKTDRHHPLLPLIQPSRSDAGSLPKDRSRSLRPFGLTPGQQRGQPAQRRLPRPPLNQSRRSQPGTDIAQRRMISGPRIFSSCDSRGTPLGVTLTGVSPSTRHSPTSRGIRVSLRRHQHCRSAPTRARPVHDGPVPSPQRKSRAGQQLNQGLGVGTHR
jgi:hypothetical protein